MGTFCEISADADAEVTNAAFGEISRIESVLSTWRTDSELSTLNRTPAGQPATVSQELLELLSRSLDWSARTEGAFNPLSGRIIEAWGLRGSGSLPEPATILAARDSTDIGRITLDAAKRTITRDSDGRFEEGAFGKGYALDRAIEVLRKSGSERGYLNFGGQISLFGHSATAIDIASPLDRSLPVVRLQLPNGSISTSSGSEKTFTMKGRTFAHIVDPRTGQALPPRGSVSVYAASAFDADVLSTALYVLGPEAGMVWAEHNGVAALFLFPHSDGRIELQASSALKKLTRLESLSKTLFVKD